MPPCMDTSENQRAHRGGKTLHKPDVLESAATVGNRGWRFAAKRRVFVHLVPIELLLEQRYIWCTVSSYIKYAVTLRRARN